MEKRKLGRSGIEVSAMGLGCWAIGGQFFMEGKVDGWGDVDDAESIKALERAFDLGVNFLDTADAYGIGHSEEIVRKAIAGKRDRVVVSTKFGFFGSRDTKTLQGTNLTPEYIERACDASLRRLGTDYIDIYFLHVWEVSISDLNTVCDTLDRLVERGKIRTYGWSTDLLGGAKLIAERENCSAIQQRLNIIEGSTELLQLCEEKGLSSVDRSPLAMGFLTGKFNAETRLPKNDVRGAGFDWTRPIFDGGKPTEEALGNLDAIREILISGGRTPAQGALGWIWAKSGVCVPIPGFKTVKQVEENAKAMEFGPLSAEQTAEIDRLVRRTAIG